jgi:regulator of protease activity HflC (stomatin/prohibitin superfamily)
MQGGIMISNKAKLRLGILGTVGVLILILLFTAVRSVATGTVQVVTSFGRVTGRVLKPGLNTIFPIAESTLTYNTKKIIYETTSEDKLHRSNADYRDDPVDTNTKDGQQVNIYYTVRFSVDPEKVTWVAQHVGNETDLVEKIVKTDSRIWARNIPREFEAEHLYTGNVQEVQNRIEEKLKPMFNANGIILDEVGIREIKFSEEYVSAIEAKQIEFVKIQTEKNKAEQAKAQKEARITQAEGQKREQELLRESITKEIIQKSMIEKWDGKMPLVMGSGNIMDISSLLSPQKK